MDRKTAEALLETLEFNNRPFINGTFIDPVEDHWMSKSSPVDGRELPPLAVCTTTDINHAVATARAAFCKREWPDLHPHERKLRLLKLADLMEEHRQDLALMDTIETGRCLQNYLEDSIPKAIAATRYFAESIDKLYDHAIPDREGHNGIIQRQPLGVTGLITPWNDPLVVAMWKIAPALAMGNTIVAKPAEQSSYSLLRVAELTLQAGIPRGVFNVVTGKGEEAGRALALHDEVAAIYFTGSSATGKKILEYAGQSNMKRVSLECGGKSAFIVTSRCRHVREAASTLAHNMFYNQGQICSAPSRAIVDAGILDIFLEQLQQELDRFSPGHPLEPDTRVGCMVSHDQQQKVVAYIRRGQQCSLRQWSASSPHGMPRQAIFITPIVFLVDDPQCEIWREEIFGPVLTVMSSSSLEKSIEIANDSSFGLAAAIWTDDLDEAYHASRRLEAGIIHVNSYGEDDNSAPFGGIKESGIGKDKSILAFDEYSYLKTIWTRHRRPDEKA